ncbi:MAG: hypothetical protein GY845_27940 [Planctomycetes bacterium]|nr:hypothetical protein [Planctomycetota bacterium]
MGIKGGAGQRGERHGEGGSGQGFGQMTLSSYCSQTGLDVNEALKKLQNSGFKASSEMTIRSIADSTGAHPSEIRTLLESPSL